MGRNGIVTETYGLQGYTCYHCYAWYNWAYCSRVALNWKVFRENVFGYGVMLLELIIGQRAFDLARLANDDDVMWLDWVKGLLKDRKVETLVDADIQGNCVKDEVEQLIQVALFFTLSSPMERPKISEVVRMLEGMGWRRGEKSGKRRRCSGKSSSISTTKITIGSLPKLTTFPTPFPTSV
ncbi:unnamed protein product [Camellia sinensis]